MKVIRKFIDWDATGNKLFRLRSDNSHLRRYVCSMLKKNTNKCNSKTGDCETCEDKYMDKNISRSELAQVFGVSDSVINNWETGRTEIGIEDLLFYCQIAQVSLEDILVYHK
ncbi:MAG: helix-turn-helix domain-containing protein [Clostridia bacterium]|nr:helix-turn-helix domain-containing protein [Clostridia bacterium]